MAYNIGGNSVDITKEVSKGSVWKELLFAFIASIPFFTQGIETDALTSSAHAGNIASNASGQALGAHAHVPWGTTAHVLAAAASAPMLCYVIERFGRKVGIFIVSLVQGISCIPLLLDVNATTTIILHILAGVTNGGLFTVFPIYVREISSTRQRGLALSLFIPMTAAGYLMRLAADFDALVFLMVGLVVFQMLMVFCLVESPSYLVMIGEYERAKRNVSRLKCLPEEHPAVLEEVAILKDESDRARAVGRLHTVTISKQQRIRKSKRIGNALEVILESLVSVGGSLFARFNRLTFVDMFLTNWLKILVAFLSQLVDVPYFYQITENGIKIFIQFVEIVTTKVIWNKRPNNDPVKNPIWRDATKIGVILHTVVILGGSVVFLDQEKTLLQLQSTADPNRVLTLVSFCTGAVVCTALIRVMERRYLLTAAFSVMALSMGILAVYTQADLTVYTLRWVPVAALGVLVAAYGVVWGLPEVLAAELFNCEIRSHQLALFYVYSQVIKLAHVHSFPYIEAYMGVYSVFYLFVGMNMFGAVYCLFHIPQIKDKTTEEIERQLKRVPFLQ